MTSILERIRFRTQILVLLIAIMALSLGVTALIAQPIARAHYRDVTFNRLESVARLKAAWIESEFDRMHADLRLATASPLSSTHLRAFREAIELLATLEGEEAALAALRRIYVEENPYPPAERARFDGPTDTPVVTPYDAAHLNVHPVLREFARGFGYRDLMLIDAETDRVVYSSAKASAYLSVLSEEPWSATGVGRCYARIQSSPGTAALPSHAIVDFAAPDAGAAPAAFHGTAIFDNGAFIGALIMEIPIERIERIMGERQGLGESGETYIVGPDLLMRNASRFEGFGKPLEQRVETDATRAGLAGEEGRAVILDYRGTSVFSVWLPLRIMDLNWVLISEIDEAEALAAVGDPLRKMTGWWMALGALLVVLAYVFARQVDRPVRSLVDQANALAEGRPVKRTRRVASAREFAELGAAFDGMATQIQHRTEALERARREAEESQRLHRAIIETARDAIITIDEAGEVVMFNPAAQRLYGYEEGEVIGRSVLDLIPPGFRETARENLKKMFADPKVSLGERRTTGTGFEGVRRDGSVFPLSSASSPVILPDRTLITTILHDITDVIEREKELSEAREAAEEASRAKSDFLANMSHELRTPMNAILGYSEMLQEEAEDLDQESFIPDLKKIHAAGRHLLELINDILDLSKIEAGKMELFLEDFDVAQAIQDVSGTIQPLIEKNSNTLVIDCPEDIGIIHADLTKVRQTLFNLLSNASKFTKDGTVTLRAARETVGGAESVRFDVSDTGIGIPADKIGRLFDAFTQADASTTREYGGTGLGLAISQRFCRMMGGEIEAVSEPGEGSTFSFYIPVAVTPEEAGKPQSGGTGEAGAAQEMAGADAVDVTDVEAGVILVIDDEANTRELLERSLTREGFQIVTATTGEEGLRLAAELKPSLITLDVMMPGMDGWAVLKELKANPATEDIPVALITISTDRNMGYALGAAEFMTKPIDRDRLLAMLEKYHCPHDRCPVLIVEDDEETRSMLARTLAKAGWEPIEAGNGKIGLERLDETTPRLILLDLMMPVMDGFEFVMELRKREEGREIPVIVLTAKDLTREDRRALAGNVESVIQKGAYTRETLIEEIKRMIRRRHHAPAGTGDGGEET